MASVRRFQQLRPIIQQFTHANQTNPEVIEVTPEVSQFDQKVHIRVQGLPSQSKVTVLAVTDSVWRRQPVQYVSCGQYLTSHTGQLDLQKDGSVGGTYTGVEPMGLFWSMIPSPLGPKNIRLVVKNVEHPMVYRLSVYQGHLTLDDMLGEKCQHQPLSTRVVRRVVLDPHVRRIPVKEGRLRGMLFLPPGEGPFPGVLDIFGMAGGLVEVRGALLASHGFAAFSLAFFGYDDLPRNFRDQTLDYFTNAVSWFSSHLSVQSGGIGVVAVSGGAVCAIMMSYKCPEIKAFVSINSSTYHSMWDEIVVNNRRFRRGAHVDESKLMKTEEGLRISHAVITQDEQMVPLWERDVPMLVLVSGDDELSHTRMAFRFHQMYPKDRRHLIEMVLYPRTGHLLEPPNTPLCRFCYNPVYGTDLLWGGYVKEHAAAQEDSWQKIIHFLQKHLSSSP